MTKLLILSRYDRQGASSRLRTMQYIPFLKSAGMEVEVSPLFDAAYLADIYRGDRNHREIANAYLKRLARMRRGDWPDIIWLEKEALPWLPWALERMALPGDIPIVADYDDAVFHRYDKHRHALVKGLLGRKIDKVMAHSTVVTAGNNYLAERARSAGARHVEIIPTVVNTEAYQLKPPPSGAGKRRIGWIGTPETWASFGSRLFDLVCHVARQRGGVFRAVGAGPYKGDRTTEVEFLDWSEKEEISLIQGMDVGIMPLPDTPWTRGKCGYKLIQYMACGLPVVASSVGVNRDIVEPGVNGFLADTDEEWRRALDTLLGDEDLCRRMGAEGRKKVEQQYSLQAYGPKVANILRDAALKIRRRAA